MKRVLVGFVMDGKSGGTDSYLMNFLNSVSGEDVRLDFLTNHIEPELKEWLKPYHSHLYEIANLHHPVKQYHQVCRLIRKNQYDTAYFNISTAIDCPAAFAAKRCRVKKRVLHSHSSGIDWTNPIKRSVYSFIHYICRSVLYLAGTDFYAVSNRAGKWMFPEKVLRSNQFHTIVSGINTEKYHFDRAVREKVRAELEIGKDALVIGHVGNFLYAKNHGFLLKVFREVLRERPDTVLLLAGKGEEQEVIRKKIAEYHMETSVKLLGWRSDVDRLLQAMDAFIMPSHFEGLPIIGLEAQAAGLLCLFSKNVTPETKINNACYFLSLKKSPKVWAKFLLGRLPYKREEVKMSGGLVFDLKEQKTAMEEIL